MSKDMYIVGFDRGYRDACDGKSYHNPYQLGSDEADGYREAYDLGEEDTIIEKGH